LGCGDVLDAHLADCAPFVQDPNQPTSLANAVALAIHSGKTAAAADASLA